MKFSRKSEETKNLINNIGEHGLRSVLKEMTVVAIDLTDQGQCTYFKEGLILEAYPIMLDWDVSGIGYCLYNFEGLWLTDEIEHNKDGIGMKYNSKAFSGKSGTWANIKPNQIILDSIKC